MACEFSTQRMSTNRHTKASRERKDIADEFTVIAVTHTLYYSLVDNISVLALMQRPMYFVLTEMHVVQARQGNFAPIIGIWLGLRSR